MENHQLNIRYIPTIVGWGKVKIWIQAHTQTQVHLIMVVHKTQVHLTKMGHKTQVHIIIVGTHQGVGARHFVYP